MTLDIIRVAFFIYLIFKNSKNTITCSPRLTFHHLFWCFYLNKFMLFYFLRRLLSSLYPFIIVVSSCCYFFTQTAYSHFSPVPSQPALFSTPSRCREAVVDSRYWNKGRAGGRQKVGRSRSRRFHFPTEVGPRKWSDEWSEASEQCGHFPSHVAVAGQGRGPLRASVCLSVWSRG